MSDQSCSIPGRSPIETNLLTQSRMNPALNAIPIVYEFEVRIMGRRLHGPTMGLPQ
jgi:hypothetical protein